jgi:hypothetical protein
MTDSMQTLIAEDPLGCQGRHAGIVLKGHLFAGASKEENGRASVANIRKGRVNQNAPAFAMHHERILHHAAQPALQTGKPEAAVVCFFAALQRSTLQQFSVPGNGTHTLRRKAEPTAACRSTGTGLFLSRISTSPAHRCAGGDALNHI